MKKIYCPLCGTKLVQESRRAFCPQCGIYHYDNPLPATAAVALNGRGEVLLVKRAVEPARGQWSLPGGFREGNETPREGAKRELREETGLEGKIEGLIDVLYEKSPFYGPLIIIGYRMEIVGGELRAGDDAEEVAFFLPEDVPDVAFESHRRFLKEVLS